MNPGMSFSLGVGIVTRTRKDILRGTIERVREMAPVTMTGVNKGIAWNRNRALFPRARVLNRECIPLPRDDTRPHAAGWQSSWPRAASDEGSATGTVPFHSPGLAGPFSRTT